MEEGLCIIGIAVKDTLHIIANRLSIGACKNFFFRLPPKGNLLRLGKLSRREICDIILNHCRRIQLLTVNIERIDFCNIRRLSVRSGNFLFNIRDGDEIINAITCQPALDVLDLQFLPAVAIGVDIVCNRIVRRLLDDNAVIGNFNRGSNFNKVEERLDILLIQANATV